MEIFPEIGPRKIFLVPPKFGARSPPMVVTPKTFRWGSWCLHEILLYRPTIIYRNLRWALFPKWWLFRNRELCILNKNSGDDTLNAVLHVRASVCWTFRSHDPLVFEPGPTTPQISNQIDNAAPTHARASRRPWIYITSKPAPFMSLHD